MPSLPIPVFGAAVLMFVFLRLWITRERLTPIAILVGICAVQTLIIALAQHYMVPGTRLIQPITATCVAPIAWCAFQWTAVRPARRSDLLHVLVPLTAMAALITAPAFLDIFVPGAFMIYGTAILVQSNKGPDAQPRAFLVNGNLPSQIWKVIGIALMVSALSDVLIVAAIAMGQAHLQPWVISLFSIGNLLLIGMISLSSHLQAEDITDEKSPTTTTEADPEVWARVQSYMSTHKPYLDPDLTLARLSRKLSVPAKTLSIAINRETGGNVSRYVNDARISAAQTALLEGETVTTAMLSSGFNTKSNFNREFLRTTGTSPSRWLNQTLT